MKRLFRLESYRRITSTNNYIPEIDGMRFIAIITVVLLHIQANYIRVFSANVPEGYDETLLFRVLHNSDWGVKFFFAISGYILCVPFARHYLKKPSASKISLKKYFVRRLTRLEPPFLISIVGIYLVNLLLSTYSFKESIDHFLATLTYSHVFVFGDWSNINPVTWSLETEVQFYIIAPFLATVFLIRNRAVRITIMSMLVVVSSQLIDLPFLIDLHLHKSIIPNLHYFIVGYLVAEVQLNNQEFFKTTNWVYDIIAWLGIPLLYLAKLEGSIIAFDFILLLFFVSIFKSISFKKFLSLPWISTIGGMCYTIYLLHYALIFVIMDRMTFLASLDFHVSLLVAVVLCCLIVLTVSMVYFHFLERPFMKRDWHKNLKTLFK